MKDKFKHHWLTDKDIAYSSQTGLWWLSYVEGKGMFCLLCRKHNLSNKFNKSKIFNIEPSVRYRKPTLLEHVSTQPHRDAVAAEHLQRVSDFHKEVVDREKTADSVLFKVFIAIYWLAQQEISNMKLGALLELFDVIGNNEIRHFTYRSRETIRDMFLVIGQVMLERILKKLTEVRYVGLLCDDVTDIAVMEQFITFVQFVDPETASLETKFLFVENALEKSDTSDAETLFEVLYSKLDTLGIEVDKVSSLASDGAAVMLGKNSRLATRLKELNAKILSVHCIRHRLALACTDSNKDVEYVANVEDILRQLWKYLENSPKRMAAYLKVQQDIKALDLSQKGKRIITKKLKKACKTRWLSFDSAVEATSDELEAVMKTLTILESDATAVSLLKKKFKIQSLWAAFIF